jgi:hypothetical protein
MATWSVMVLAFDVPAPILISIEESTRTAPTPITRKWHPPNLSSRQVPSVRANSGRRRVVGSGKSRESTLICVRAEQVFVHIFREIP